MSQCVSEALRVSGVPVTRVVHGVSFADSLPKGAYKGLAAFGIQHVQLSSFLILILNPILSSNPPSYILA